MGVIIRNNKVSRDYGIIVEVEPNYEVAERAYEIISVPGRGDVAVDLKYYRNVERKYQIAVAEEGGKFTTLAPKMAEWLNGGSGYVRLEDSYYPDQYVMARISSSIDIINVLKQAGRAEITFDRMPKRYLKSGEVKYSITNNQRSIVNPTPYDSSPRLTVYGTGNTTFWVGYTEVEVAGINGYVTIDCETGEVYKDNIPQNNATFKHEYPVLLPGINNITFNPGITKIEVEPRWWLL